MRIAAEKKRKQDEERRRKHEEDSSCKQPYGNGSKSFDLNPNKKTPAQ